MTDDEAGIRQLIRNWVEAPFVGHVAPGRALLDGFSPLRTWSVK